MSVSPRNTAPSEVVRARATREEEIRLAALAAEGDRAAQRQVVQRLYGGVRNVIGYAVNDATLAEDISQSAMLKVLHALKDYRGDSSLGFWSTRIAVRMAMKALKTRARRRQLLFFLPEPRTPFEEPDMGVSVQELRRQINRVVSRLPNKQQMAIRLQYVHGYSIEEIAALTNVPKNTVRDRLRVGKKKLKGLLEKNPEIAEWITRGKS